MLCKHRREVYYARQWIFASGVFGCWQIGDSYWVLRFNTFRNYSFLSSPGAYDKLPDQRQGRFINSGSALISSLIYL